ncbi:MAG: cyclic nucleotide-binding domain-containing protein [Desulfobacula sp.]|nr:cyclic nucleotide-binding domain-containing protein [Desulfobacula sp.]
MPKDLKTNLLSEKIISIMRKFMIFENIESHDIKTILNANPESNEGKYHKRIAKLCQYDKGEIVIKEGEFDSWSFWVIKGVFDVIQNGIPIATFADPGEIFGEMSVFEGIPRTASVVSITDGICLCIDMSIIENLNDKKIETIIKEGFYTVILERLGNTKEIIEDDRKKLEEKYADLLAFEKKIKNKAKKKPKN